MHRPKIAGVLFGSPGGGSFVEAGVRAFERARTQFSADVQMHWLDRVEPEWRVAQLHEVARSGPALIVLHGAQGEAIAQAVAADYPDIQFSVSQGEVSGANLSSFEVLLEQPAFLAGMLAGWSSRNGVVGHLSGERVRAGLKGRAAFAAGLHHTAPAARLLSTFCGSQHDAGLAARCVRAQADAGADIVFTMLGAGRTGAIDACREAGIRQIGDGIDWCAIEPDVFLASAVADSGWGSFRAIELLVKGQLSGRMHETAGLENPVVCHLATAPGLTADICALIESAAEDIVAGRVTVPTAWEGVVFEPKSGII